jgi:A/G-specific adenine glycosylase
MINKQRIDDFQSRVLAWYDYAGRKFLPWQQDITPYKVWLSEIMLQQTQVNTVIPYFNRFLSLYPTVYDLAAANQDEVLRAWAGLGYYARARNLHKTAQIIVDDYQGCFPKTVALLSNLPGIGLSTAGAIAAIAYHEHAAILDGNVKRVLSRVFAISGWSGDSRVLQTYWDIARTLTPKQRVRDYTQAMMDLGALVCTRTQARCEDCPLSSACLAYQTNTIEIYPTKKPKKILPVKHTIMLVLENDQGEILLEKRPLSGIWGGLWSFPEFDVLNSLQVWYEAFHGKGFNPQTITGFRHTFTHYHLEITAIHLSTSSGCKPFLNESQQFIALSSLSDYGKPVPVDKILGVYCHDLA